MSKRCVSEAPSSAVMHRLLAAVLLLGACNGVTETDAVTSGGGSAAEVGSAGAGGSTSSVRASVAGQSGAGGSGQGGAAVSQGGSPGAGIDDPGGLAPPPECIPSCIWDIFKDCLPGPVCIAEYSTRNDGGLGQVVARCEPDTGWYSHSGGCCSAGLLTEVSLNGVPCYSVRWGGKAPLFGKVYSRDDGEAQAEIAHDFTSYLCGSLTGTPAPLDPTRPECAPWFERLVPSEDCAIGECAPP